MTPDTISALREWAVLHEPKGLVQARQVLDLLDLLKWQPISTAPKDGTSVLCWHRLWDMPKFAFLESSPLAEECGWKLTETMFMIGVCPTHWQPLPPPPQEKVRESSKE